METTYYLLDIDHSNKWTMFEYRGKPYGDGQIRLVERPGLELGCAKLVQFERLALTPQSAYDKAMQKTRKALLSAKQRVQHEQENLDSLLQFKP